MGASLDLKMGEQRDSPNLSTRCEGIPNTSLSVLTSSSQSVGTSLLPPCPFSTTIDIGMSLVSHKFL